MKMVDKEKMVRSKDTSHKGGHGARAPRTVPGPIAAVYLDVL
jgi:hypothetical protein